MSSPSKPSNEIIETEQQEARPIHPGYKTKLINHSYSVVTMRKYRERGKRIQQSNALTNLFEISTSYLES
jgi:hypothetical protein